MAQETLPPVHNKYAVQTLYMIICLLQAIPEMKEDATPSKKQEKAEQDLKDKKVADDKKDALKKKREKCVLVSVAFDCAFC